jgi:hypothetical protein
MARGGAMQWGGAIAIWDVAVWMVVGAVGFAVVVHFFV